VGLGANWRRPAAVALACSRIVGLLYCVQRGGTLDINNRMEWGIKQSGQWPRPTWWGVAIDRAATSRQSRGARSTWSVLHFGTQVSRGSASKLGEGGLGGNGTYRFVLLYSTILCPGISIPEGLMGRCGGVWVHTCLSKVPLDRHTICTCGSVVALSSTRSRKAPITNIQQRWVWVNGHCKYPKFNVLPIKGRSKGFLIFDTILYFSKYETRQQNV
jgi:hypothetical protein